MDCGKWVRNKYTNRKIYVSCGHCPACVHRKAQRVTRKIKNHTEQNGRITVFVTLTYTNYSVPFIIRTDRDFYNNLIIYRNVFNPEPIGRVNYSGTLDPETIDNRTVSLKPLRGQGNKAYIGVLLYSDLQNFIKRFRINYERTYKEKPNLTFFEVAEYGGLYSRPHFHVLMSFPTSTFNYGKILDTCVASWSFGNPIRFRQRGFEIAKDAARYVSGYLLKSNSLHALLRSPQFKQKRSHSTFYGLNKDKFGVEKIKNMLSTRTPEYTIQFNRDNKSCSLSVPIPKYIRDYYICNPQGFSLLSPWEKRYVLYAPEVYLLCEKLNNYYSNKNFLLLCECLLYDEYINSGLYSFYFGNFEEFYNSVIILTRKLRNTWLSADPFDYNSHYYICYRHIVLRSQRFGVTTLSDRYDFMLFQMEFSSMWYSYMIQFNHSDKFAVSLAERYDNAFELVQYDSGLPGEPLYINPQFLLYDKNDLFSNSRFLEYLREPNCMQFRKLDTLERIEDYNTRVAQETFNDLCITLGNELFNSNYN